LKARIASVVFTALAVLMVLFAATMSPSARAQEPTAAGLWQKLDRDGKPISWFLFVDRGGVFEGRIAKLFPQPGEKPNPTCTSCTDDRKGAPILGLPFVRGMKRVGLEYEGGSVLDPRDGTIYSAVMKLDPAKQTLTLRGFVLLQIAGKNDVWHRLPDSAYAQLDPAIVQKYAPERAESKKGKAKSPQR
jgi:Uncharacterized protein conserved in bacteria (DUF2147)